MRRKNPGELFLWREPFEPIARLEPGAGPARASSNRPGRHQAVFVGFNLLGDFLCTTPVVRAYRKAHPDDYIVYVAHNAGYSRLLDNNPDIDLALYRDDLYEHGEVVLSPQWLRRLPLCHGDPATLYRFNIHEVCRSDPHVFEDHIACGLARYLGIPIDSVRPVVELRPHDRALARALVRRPYVVFGMHATSQTLDPQGEMLGKDWVFDRWITLAQRLRAWGYDVVTVGSELDRQTPSRHFRALNGLPIQTVAALLEGAACLVTVEGGLSHLAHAVDAPMVVIFSKYVRYAWAFPREASRCRVLYDDPRLISCEDVTAEVRALLTSNAELP